MPARPFVAAVRSLPGPTVAVTVTDCRFGASARSYTRRNGYVPLSSGSVWKWYPTPPSERVSTPTESAASTVPRVDPVTLESGRYCTTNREDGTGPVVPHRRSAVRPVPRTVTLRSASESAPSAAAGVAVPACVAAPFAPPFAAPCVATACVVVLDDGQMSTFSPQDGGIERSISARSVSLPFVTVTRTPALCTWSLSLKNV